MDRYWITEVQLGVMLAIAKINKTPNVIKLLNKVQREQYIGTKADYDKLLILNSLKGGKKK